MYLCRGGGLARRAGLLPSGVFLPWSPLKQIVTAGGQSPPSSLKVKAELCHDGRAWDTLGPRGQEAIVLGETDLFLQE